MRHLIVAQALKCCSVDRDNVDTDTLNKYISELKEKEAGWFVQWRRQLEPTEGVTFRPENDLHTVQREAHIRMCFQC